MSRGEPRAPTGTATVVRRIVFLVAAKFVVLIGLTAAVLKAYGFW